MGRHFDASVALGAGRPLAFLVDTGATVTPVAPELLDESKAGYRVLQPMVTMTTADGPKVTAQRISTTTRAVAPWVPPDVSAVRCAHCIALLNQSSPSHTDLRSIRTEGVEFLTLTPRGGI